MMSSFRALAARPRTLPSCGARKARIQGEASGRQANSFPTDSPFRERLQARIRPACRKGTKERQEMISSIERALCRFDRQLPGRVSRPGALQKHSYSKNVKVAARVG